MVEAPLVPVSCGELVDKITILEIKCARLRAPSAIANATRELGALTAILATLNVPGDLAPLRSDLRGVNESLWDIEDAIRAKEASGDFGSEFVVLARSVYRQNDERWRIKRKIDRLFGSSLLEEKQYPGYP